MQKTMILCETGNNFSRWCCIGDSREAAEREYHDAILLRDFPRPLYRVIIKSKR
jgi:hypothetical protein